jgi:hypothetical protein
MACWKYTAARRSPFSVRPFRKNSPLRINLPGYGAQTPAQSSGGTGTVKEQVSKLTAGTFIEVRFTNKTKVRGYLSSVEADGFSFKEGSPASSTVRQAAFSDVKSVKVITKTHTPVGAWIAFGVIVAVLVIAVVVVGIERHNE